MPYEIRFDIAGIIITLILLYVFFAYKHFPTWRSKIFIQLSLDILASLVLNIVTCYTGYYWKNDKILWNNLLSVIHIIAVNLIPLYYVTFIFSLTHSEQNFSWKVKTVLGVLTSYALLTIGTSPFTHFVMYFNENNEYCHGPGMTVLYIFSVGSMIIGLYMIIRSKIKLDFSKRSVAVFYTVATCTATIIQYFHPHLLLIGFSCTISLFLTYLTIQNPLAFLDLNAGTYNRNAFNELVSARIDSRKRYSLIMLNLSNVDKLKELFGIENGYYILRQYTKQICTVCNDSYLFHLFGNCYTFLCKSEEEFLKKENALLSFIQQTPLVDTGMHARNKIEYPLSTNISTIKIDHSWYTNTNSPLSIDDVVDTMKYVISSDISKSTSTIHSIDPATFSNYKEKVIIQKAIRAAIDTNSFEVHLQPIYDLRTKTFTSAESLLRLKGLDESYIKPSLFIPEAERNGDILKIGDIALRKTCEYIQKTNLLSLGIQKININLSMLQCMQEGIVNHFITIIDHYNIPRDCIRFEITESMVAQDEARLEKMISEMTKFGITFALDDYGTGYSNTARIMHFQFTEIKFDKSIIDAFQEKTSYALSLKHLFSMGKERNMLVLAEGVETKET